MKVWCYVLDANGVSGLTSFDGSEVGTPLFKHLYECEDDNIDLAQDGTGKLYHAANDKINDTDLQNALNVYYPPVPEYAVQIRYTATEDLTLAGIAAEGGTAEVIEVSPGVYDLVSTDPLTFVALDFGGDYYYNYYNTISRVEVLKGSTLLKVKSDTTYHALVQNYDDMTEFVWSDATPSMMQDTEEMFNGCRVLSTADFSATTMNELVNAWNMFLNVSAMTSLSLPISWGGAAFINMAYMFNNMPLVEHIDLTGLNMNAMLDCRNLFNNMSGLVCITNIDTTIVATNGGVFTQMFIGCTSLTSPDVLTQTQITATGGFNYVNPNPCPVV